MILQLSRMNRSSVSHIWGMLLGAVMIVGLCQTATAAPLCVNPGGTSGCYSTIGAAVAAAPPYSTILVAPGTYTEDVIIEHPLTLLGANSTTTIIDASGKSNGIYINGQGNAALRNVVVTGFTVEKRQLRRYPGGQRHLRGPARQPDPGQQQKPGRGKRRLPEHSAF